MIRPSIRVLPRAVLLFLIAVGATTAAATRQAPATGSPTSTIGRFDRAVAARDLAALDVLLAPTFSAIDPAGGRIDREQLLAPFRRPGTSVLSGIETDLAGAQTTLASPGTAVVVVNTTHRFTGNQPSASYRVTYRLSLADGQWRISSMESTPLLVAPSSTGGPAADRASVVAAAARTLRERYVFPEIGERMAVELERRQAAGEFRAIEDPKVFAKTLSDLFEAVGHDKHVRIAYAPPVPGQTVSPLAIPFPDFMNDGFYRVERLPGNIGYIDLRSFMYQPGVPLLTTAAMQFVSRSDALVIDLRKNGGGQMQTQLLIASYFLPAPTRWADTLLRDRPTQEWSTSETVDGPRFLDKPVYILNSNYTFSAAESFAFHLRRLGRVTLVGETTGGGANPGVSIPLGGDFSMFVAIGQNVAPGTHDNWEGKGVAPDIAVPAEDSLRIAQLTLLRKLLPATTEPKLRAERVAAIAELEAAKRD